MDLRLREIRDPADVIGVEVGDDDVADVGALEGGLRGIPTARRCGSSRAAAQQVLVLADRG